MAKKAKHAFGLLENIDKALSEGKIDSYDIIFAKDANGNPHIGWIDANGEKVILQTDNKNIVVVEGESLPELGEVGKIYILGEDAYVWTGSQFANLCKPTDVSALEDAIAAKADASDVETKFKDAKAYTDDKVESAVEAAMSEHLIKRYVIEDVPAGTLVDYFDKEIRVMCPANAEFTKQAVGAGGDANSYYMTFKTFVPSDDIVGYIEHLNGTSDPEVLTDLKTDKYGRKYQPTWLALAKYDDATGWTYYGAKSSTEGYIGYDYQIDWFNADGVMVKSDVIRINLSNEDCHNTVEPYYIGSVRKEIDTKIEEKIAEVEGAIEIVEF